jgi:hypothetical protein
MGSQGSFAESPSVNRSLFVESSDIFPSEKIMLEGLQDRRWTTNRVGIQVKESLKGKEKL